uniref:Uncharacterized protein n=1 Tax=Panagrellus redivivus TaxID=6233 RepID=A0A7E4VK34_PANRE
MAHLSKTSRGKQCPPEMENQLMEGQGGSLARGMAAFAKRSKATCSRRQRAYVPEPRSSRNMCLAWARRSRESDWDIAASQHGTDKLSA